MTPPLRLPGRIGVELLFMEIYLRSNTRVFKLSCGPFQDTQLMIPCIQPSVEWDSADYLFL